MSVFVEGSGGLAAHASAAYVCCFMTDDLSVSSSSVRHLGLDLVPRKEFEMVDEDQISVSDLYKMVRPLFNDSKISLH